MELADADDRFVVTVRAKERDEWCAGEVLGDQRRDASVMRDNVCAFACFGGLVYHLNLQDSSSAYQKKNH